MLTFFLYVSTKPDTLDPALSIEQQSVTNALDFEMLSSMAAATGGKRLPASLASWSASR